MRNATHAGGIANLLALALTPHGRLLLQHDPDGAPLPFAVAARLQTAFTRGAGHGLLQLAAAEVGAVLPPVTSCMRALWPQLVGDEELMSTAWSIEGMLVEATELGGPLAVGVLVLFVAPVSAILVAAGLSYVGAMLFALSRASLGWRTQRVEGRAIGRG